MRTSAARLVTAVAVAVTGIYLGVKLGVYAEADDAPGGVVIAALLVMGSVVLGIWIALRARKPSPNGG